MCRHIQPKKNQKSKIGFEPAARGTGRRRAQRRRAGRGLEPNLRFFGFFLGCIWRHIKGEGRKYMFSYVFIGFPCFYKILYLLPFTFYLLPSTFYLLPFTLLPPKGPESARRPPGGPYEFIYIDLKERTR